ncbi:MAG TPA: serine/threonine-protein kinase [Kofleriaceae bacterium]
MTDPLIGKVLANRYQISRVLGEGAMGRVYLAHHIKVGRPFAIKILHARLLDDPKQVARFEREAELAGRLHHANVIGVVDIGQLDELRYMVMDYVEGKDLSSLLAEAPMKPERIISLTRQLLEGLFHAHEQGLIHRDLKPENVIIERDAHGEEVPRILDFGVAILREGGASNEGIGRLTSNGLVLGTPHYMAPEQAIDDPIDHRIDLFALGIMIYELLSGVLPFEGTGSEVARSNLVKDPPKISDRVPHLAVDPLLEAFARLLMAKKRDARPPTAKVARELLDLIERDREVAAIDLGVPLELAHVRSTESAEPLRAPTMRAPVAIRQQPPSPPEEPIDELPPPPRRKRAVIGAGLAAFAILLVILLSVSRRDEIQAAPAFAKPVTMPVAMLAAPPPIENIEPMDLQADDPPEVVIDPPTSIRHRRTPRTVVHAMNLDAPYDAAMFRSHWQAVGEELFTYIHHHGVNSVTELQQSYTAISFMAAAASQQGRDDARKKLDAIHAKLAATP